MTGLTIIPHTINTVTPATTTSADDSIAEHNNSSGSGGTGEFGSLFSPLKFLDALDERGDNKENVNHHTNIENHMLDDAASLGVMPFDVDEPYYDPISSTPMATSSQPHILRRPAYMRRRKEPVRLYFQIEVIHEPESRH